MNDRDEFAKAALQGLLATDHSWASESDKKGLAQWLAHHAYNYADAMMDVRAARYTIPESAICRDCGLSLAGHDLQGGCPDRF